MGNKNIKNQIEYATQELNLNRSMIFCFFGFKYFCDDKVHDNILVLIGKTYYLFLIFFYSSTTWISRLLQLHKKIII